MDTKERSIARFEARGVGDDVPWHAQIKAIVEQGGGSQLLESKYDSLVGGLRKPGRDPHPQWARSHRGDLCEVDKCPCCRARNAKGTITPSVEFRAAH